eukprot:scaffold22646_cov68-Phaeocystis_antarctica.AAC.12
MAVAVATAAASVAARSRRQRCTSHAEVRCGPSSGAVSRAGVEISISAATGRWSEIERSSQLEYEMTRSAACRSGVSECISTRSVYDGTRAVPSAAATEYSSRSRPIVRRPHLSSSPAASASSSASLSRPAAPATRRKEGRKRTGASRKPCSTRPLRMASCSSSAPSSASGLPWARASSASATGSAQRKLRSPSSSTWWHASCTAAPHSSYSSSRPCSTCNPPRTRLAGGARGARAPSCRPPGGRTPPRRCAGACETPRRRRPCWRRVPGPPACLGAPWRRPKSRPRARLRPHVLLWPHVLGGRERTGLAQPPPREGEEHDVPVVAELRLRRADLSLGEQLVSLAAAAAAAAAAVQGECVCQCPLPCRGREALLQPYEVGVAPRGHPCRKLGRGGRRSFAHIPRGSEQPRGGPRIGAGALQARCRRRHGSRRNPCRRPCCRRWHCLRRARRESFEVRACDPGRTLGRQPVAHAAAGA